MTVAVVVVAFDHKEYYTYLVDRCSVGNRRPTSVHYEAEDH